MNLKLLARPNGDIGIGTLKWPAISIEKVVGLFGSAGHFSVPQPISSFTYSYVGLAK